MGMVQIKNFVVPLTNKIHVGTILLVALIFAVYRLSGGGAEVVPGTPAASRSPALQPMHEPSKADALFEQESAQMFGSGASAAPSRGAQPQRARPNLLDEAFNARADKPRTAPPSANNRGGLDDIEKQLGLK